MLDVCLDHAAVSFDHSRGMFRPCWSYVLTAVLEIGLDSTRGILLPFSSYVSIMLAACLDRGRSLF